MKIIGLQKIEAFGKNNVQSRKPLRLWLLTTKNARWKTSADVKATFNSVDNPTGNVYVFNIGGNNYRLIAVVIIAKGTVMIDKIMTHAQYAKWKP